MHNILEVNNVTKTYPAFSLKNISFSLPEGCITGFIGVNGAGKTSVIHTILGLLQKESGTVRFFDTDIEKDAGGVKNRIGVVLDSDCFYGGLTLNQMKNIVAPAYSSWSEETFESYLQRFSLRAGQKIRTLSKGMKIKYALALALSHHAEFLIMDEPTSGLDPLIRRQILKLLADYMNDGGKGVFFSTHITSDLDKAADILLLIHNGSIVFQEEKDALLDRYQLVKGPSSLLTENNRPLFSQIQETPYGFTGLTKQADKVRTLFPETVIERPRIEDIMLAAIEGR